MRINAIREGSSRLCHLHPCLCCLSYNIFCTAFHGVKGDEISALWCGPCSDTCSADLFLQGVFHCLKFRTKDFRVFSHVLMHTFNILEETHVSQLVDLIMTDSLDSHVLSEVSQVSRRGRNRCDSGAREADLRSGNKLVCQIRIASFFTLLQNL